MEIVETKAFTANWADLGLAAKDLFELIDAIVNGPEQPVIAKTGGLRKMRLSPSSSRSGKRGGLRVCFATLTRFTLLVTVYPKTRQDDLSADEKKAIRKLLATLEKELEG